MREEQQTENHQQNKIQSEETKQDHRNQKNEQHPTSDNANNILTRQREEEIEEPIEAWRTKYAEADIAAQEEDNEDQPCNQQKGNNTYGKTRRGKKKKREK